MFSIHVAWFIVLCIFAFIGLVAVFFMIALIFAGISYKREEIEKAKRESEKCPYKIEK